VHKPEIESSGSKGATLQSLPAEISAPADSDAELDDTGSEFGVGEQRMLDDQPAFWQLRVPGGDPLVCVDCGHHSPVTDSVTTDSPASTNGELAKFDDLINGEEEMTAVSRLIGVVLGHGSAFDAAVEENLHSMKSKFCVTEIRLRIPTFEFCSHAVEAKTWFEPDHHIAPYRQPPVVVSGLIHKKFGPMDAGVAHGGDATSVVDRALVAKPPNPFVSIDRREQCGDRRKRGPFDQNSSQRSGLFPLECTPGRIRRLFIETYEVERHGVRDHDVAASPECDRVLGTGCVEFMTGGQPLLDQVALVPPL